MELHEFFLENYKVRGVTEDNQIHRTVLGKLINAEERTVFGGRNTPDAGTKTGSIGFIDLLKREVWVPKDYPKEEIRFLDFEKRLAVNILTIGIEPKYRKNPLYAMTLINKAEETARKWGFGEIVAHTISGEKFYKLLDGLKVAGYFIYANNMGIKRLK